MLGQNSIAESLDWTFETEDSKLDGLNIATELDKAVILHFHTTKKKDSTAVHSLTKESGERVYWM